jgi:hypothetical protein
MRMLLTLSAIAMSLASSGDAATVISVGEFRSVALRHGGRVVVRHGAVQRVSIIDGDRRCAQVHLDDGHRLVIDNSGPKACSHDDRPQFEVVTPHLSGVSVSNGGTVQTAGAFPAQAAIDVAVEQGGTIDIRSLAADRVEASVYSGGRIFTIPRTTLAATVESGGVITYWGAVADVKKSIHHGGVVTRGAAEEADQPLSGFGSDLPAIPPLPPLPPIPPVRNGT